MLPSLACPKITLSRVAVPLEQLVSSAQVGSRRSTGTAMSSSSAVVPDGRAPATAA